MYSLQGLNQNRKSNITDFPAPRYLIQIVTERKELEHFRIQMASLKNEVRKEKEEKQRAENEIACLQDQQQQPQPHPQPRLPVHDPQLQPDGQTPEQMAARDFVQQWSRGMQPTSHVP